MDLSNVSKDTVEGVVWGAVVAFGAWLFRTVTLHFTDSLKRRDKLKDEATLASAQVDIAALNGFNTMLENYRVEVAALRKEVSETKTYYDRRIRILDLKFNRIWTFTTELLVEYRRAVVYIRQLEAMLNRDPREVFPDLGLPDMADLEREEPIPHSQPPYYQQPQQPHDHAT